MAESTTDFPRERSLRRGYRRRIFTKDDTGSIAPQTVGDRVRVEGGQTSFEMIVGQRSRSEEMLDGRLMFSNGSVFHAAWWW